MLIDTIAINLKKEAKELVSQVNIDMNETLIFTKCEDDNRLYKKINSLREDFILRETSLLNTVNMPNPEIRKWNNNYYAFLELRDLLNLKIKVVDEEVSVDEEEVHFDFKELLNKMK